MTSSDDKRRHLKSFFTREPGHISSQFDTYIEDFPHLKPMEAAGWERLITEDEIQQSLKTNGTDRTLGSDGLPTWGCHVCEEYLKLSHLRAIVHNSLMEQRLISQRFTKNIVKFLHKSNHGGDGICNFRALTKLSTDLKILAKNLADRYQTGMPYLIGSEACYAVKSRTMKHRLHFIWRIIEKVNVIQRW